LLAANRHDAKEVVGAEERQSGKHQTIMNQAKRNAKTLKATRPLRVGFLPENDCAPLAIAHELGLFEEYGLTVELSREPTCTNVRDRIINRQLDAAHAPATLPFVLSLGMDFEQCACVSGLVLSLQGNAIALSQKLWQEGVRDAATLRDRIFQDWGRRTFTFGVVFPYSSQYFLLCQWLRAAGIMPHAHVRIVVIPSEQLFPTLELGYLDGYCVGEPWTSVAVEAGAGVCLATSVQLSPLHPEKALLVRQDFAAERADDHERLIAALREACAFCDRPENREFLCEVLSEPRYVNAPVECIKAGLIGPVPSPDRHIQNLFGLNVFSHHQTNDPSESKAAWITNHLSDFLKPGADKFNRLRPLNHIFRRDYFTRSDRFARKTSASMKTKTATPEPRPLAQAACAQA
jgi:ABC-type nitrate/sulfonate/bicarbonate transport system substrate-binding protein